MIKKIIKYIFLISMISSLLVIIIVPLIDNNDKKNIKLYDDISLYVDSEYNQLSDNYIYKITSDNCANYLPGYNEFEFKDNINGFYVFDGSKTVLRTSISFVLELQFKKTSEYERFISYEYSRCEYDFDKIISYNGYECHITKSKDLTYFYYEKDIPYQFGMLCKNIEMQKVRYVYFRECESSVDERFNVVFQNTNCDW